MRLTIIPDDSFVSVDGNNTHQPLDISNCNIPSNVHALQWFDVKGWIEFNQSVDPFAQKPPNEIIEVLPIWADNCLTAWGAWTPPPPPEEPQVPVTTIE
jgi:hypothetical protein